MEVELSVMRGKLDKAEAFAACFTEAEE